MGDRFCIPGSSQTHIIPLAVEVVGSKSLALWQNVGTYVGFAVFEGYVSGSPHI